MKTLLCILTGQHVPNLLSVHHFNPERIILAQSSDMERKKAAEHFKNALDTSTDFNFKKPEIYIENIQNENSFPDLFQQYKQIHECYPDANWIINLTGGTKPMSIAAFDYFSKSLKDKVQFVYTPFSHPNHMMDFMTGQEETCSYPLTIEEFLAGYGYIYEKVLSKIVAAEKEAEKLWETSRAMALHAGQLRCWGPERRKHIEGKTKGKKKYDLSLGDLTPNAEDIKKDLREAFDLREENGSLLGKIDETALS